MSVSVKDRRRLPFFMVTKAATAAIRGRFAGRRGQTALAVYVAIVECSNDERGDSFSKPRPEIAERAMVNVRILDDYVRELEEIGLLHVERVRDGKPNIWTLTDPDGVTHSDSTTPLDQVVHPDSVTPVHAADTTPVHSDSTTPLKEGKKEEQKDIPLPPWKGARVKSKTVTKAEGEMADAVLAAFNTAAKLDLRSLPISNGNLSMIVGRIREHPELSIDDHREIIGAVFAGNHWWEPPARLGIIYNPKQFDTAIGKRAVSAAAPPSDWQGDALLERSRKLYPPPPEETP